MATAVYVALSVSTFVSALGLALLVPLPGAMLLLPMGMMVLCAYFGVKASRRRTTRIVYPFLFTVGGVARQPLLRWSWQSIRSVSASTSRLSVQSRWLSQRINVDADPEVVAKLAASLERMRQVARANPGASPSSGYVGVSRLCAACGAASRLDLEPATCPCCGEPPDATVRRLADGRSSPAALRKSIQVLVTVATALLLVAAMPFILDVFILALLALVLAWWAAVNIMLAVKLARLGRGYLDRAWIIRDQRIDAVTGRDSLSAGWGEFTGVERGGAVRGWRLIQLRFAEAGRPPLELWIDERADDPDLLIDELRSMVGHPAPPSGQGPSRPATSERVDTPPSSETD